MGQSVAHLADTFVARARWLGVELRRDWLLALVERGPRRGARIVFTGLIEACSGIAWRALGRGALALVHDLAATAETPVYSD